MRRLPPWESRMSKKTARQRRARRCVRLAQGTSRRSSKAHAKRQSGTASSFRSSRPAYTSTPLSFRRRSHLSHMTGPPSRCTPSQNRTPRQCSWSAWRMDARFRILGQIEECPIQQFTTHNADPRQFDLKCAAMRNAREINPRTLTHFQDTSQHVLPHHLHHLPLFPHLHHLPRLSSWRVAPALICPASREWTALIRTKILVYTLAGIARQLTKAMG